MYEYIYVRSYHFLPFVEYFSVNRGSNNNTITTTPTTTNDNNTKNNVRKETHC